MVFTGTWNHDEKPIASTPYCPRECPKFINRDDKHLTGFADCDNPLEGSLCYTVSFLIILKYL